MSESRTESQGPAGTRIELATWCAVAFFIGFLPWWVTRLGTAVGVTWCAALATTCILAVIVLALTLAVVAGLKRPQWALRVDLVCAGGFLAFAWVTFFSPPCPQPDSESALFASLGATVLTPIALSVLILMSLFAAKIRQRRTGSRADGRAALGKTVWTDLSRRQRRTRLIWLCLLTAPIWALCAVALQFFTGVALIWIPVALQAIIFDIGMAQRISRPADGNPRFIFVLVLVDLVVIGVSCSIVFALSGA